MGGICSLITVSFMFIGVYIIWKGKNSQYNQYIASILAVHEHIHARADTDNGLMGKMIQCTKRTNKTNMFGAKRTIKDLKWNKAIVDNQIDDNNREEEVDDEYEYVEE